AVLRALGAPTGYLLRDGLAQALVLLLAAAAVGIGVGIGLGSLVGGGVPFALDVQAVALAAALLVGLGLTGAAVAIARIVAVDPATALGGNR
ncbi:FtsX-like permease family protein, partial [Catellatospora chokoriensis]